MSHWKLLVIIAVSVGVASFVAVQAQPKSSKGPALTALDYAEIQQLNMHYTHALDTCANKGNEFADLFAPDGVYVFADGHKKVEGREGLAAIGGGPNCAPPRDTPLHMRHIFLNPMIEPSPEGAVGESDFWVVIFNEDGKTMQLLGGAKAADVYTKTPMGWRIKSRAISQVTGHL